MTNTSDQHAGAIADYLSGKSCPPVAIGAGTDLFTSGALDSLGVADLIAFVETRYAIDVPVCDVTVQNFATPQAISAYIERRLSGS